MSNIFAEIAEVAEGIEEIAEGVERIFGSEEDDAAGEGAGDGQE